MKLNFDSPEPEVRIEIVPLIDVIFCILTFFILAAVTLTRQTAINVDLPKAASAATQMRKLLIVTVDPIGQIYVEKQPVSPEQLYQAVGNFRQASPEGTIVLYASRAASYNDVVYVLDQIRAVGGDRVALATLPGTTVPTAAPAGTLPGLENNPLLPDPSSGLGGTNLPAPLPSTLPNSSAPSSSNPLNQPTGLTPAPSGSSAAPTAPASIPRGSTGTAPSRP